MIEINDNSELEKDGKIEILKCHQAYDRYFKSTKEAMASINTIKKWYTDQGYIVRNFI